MAPTSFLLESYLAACSKQRVASDKLLKLKKIRDFVVIKLRSNGELCIALLISFKTRLKLFFS